MAKKKKGNHRKHGGFTLPVSVVAGFAPLVSNVLSVSSGGLEPMGWMATQALTGYDTRAGGFWWPNLKKGTIPIVLGILAHKIIGGKLGVNRALAAARVPFIRF
jgi:hypothetical protein